MTASDSFLAKTSGNSAIFVEDSRESRILDNIRGVIFELDSHGNFSYVNQAWNKLTGHSCAITLSKPFSSYIHPDDVTLCQTMIRRMHEADDDSVNGEIRLLHKAGHSLWIALSLDSKPTQNGKALFGYITGIDKHQLNNHLANTTTVHDAVTGAYNRHYLELDLQSHIHTLTTQTDQHGLLYLELRNLNLINQALSHSDSDIVLKDIADLLSSCLKPNDLLCRMGGYEFALFLPNSNPTETNGVADKILKRLSSYRYSREPFSFIVSGNIGIRLIDNISTSATEYIADAVKATAIAKKLGRNRSHLFNQDDDDSHHSHGCDWNHRIHEAIEQNRLRLYLQPIRAIDSQQINHYEALLRLIDADSGEVIEPERFIHALERSGAIIDVDRWVINNAIQLLSQRPKIQQLAINLSAHAFEDAQLHSLIQARLKHFQVAPQRVIIELTETSRLINLEQTHTVIKNLRAIGCQFALDDFGTGFCSFSYLKHLPADYVKLDGSYIKNICDNKIDQAMVRSMNDMVHALGHKTIAECVESTQAIDLLSDIGVDYIQGFSVGKPAPP
ncbi:MAG: EAL domain-containing protein [Gammaproteobacteria bacterium]|nr:EAL domain-containing protein [Gammaproteobacteria bacterium]